MLKVERLKKLEKAGVIAVVRGSSKEQALNASHAVIKGGMTGIELTFTVPNAEQAIQELVEMYQENTSVIIGAGTVLDATTARFAIMAGAEFIVSPCFDLETAKICNLYQIPYLPGCMSINEMKEALKAGVDIIKLFPGSAFGPSIVKAFKAPLPQLNLMPTGGVSLENMNQWFEAGVIAVGVGGNLMAPAEVDNFEEVTVMSNKYMMNFKKIKE